MKIPGRVTTKIGDVFKITANEHGSWYLQLVYIDPANMNSDVIAAFNPADTADLKVSDIVKLPHSFYLHTTTKFGVKQGIWERVGNESISVDLSKFTFKYLRDQDHVDRSRQLSEHFNNLAYADRFDSPHWDVWRIGDTDFHSMSYEEGSDFKAEPGYIYPPSQIIERIKTGRSLFL